jgi:hypothetical protein
MNKFLASLWGFWSSYFALNLFLFHNLGTLVWCIFTFPLVTYLSWEEIRDRKVIEMEDW